MMTKSNNTKRTLLASVCSMILCVAMLIGSTFAWFTDNASTAVNKIQSGTLDVALEMQDAEGNWVDAEGKTLEWIKAKGTAEDEKVLWEPGCTYELPAVHIKNNGNLALKYKIVISGIVGDAGLLKVIDFTYGDLDVNAEGYLEAGKTSDAITIKGHMKEEAGNEYQNLSIEGIGITVVATQNTVENDSYGNQYDKNAGYPVVYPAGVTSESFTGENVAVTADGTYIENTEQGIMNAIKAGGTLYFKENATVALIDQHTNVTKNLSIYANGANFGGRDISIGTYVAPENKETTVNIYNAKNLVVWGQPDKTRSDIWNINFYNCTNDGYNFLMYRGGDEATSVINLTIEKCTATGYHDSIVHTTADGMIKIANCTFINNCAPVNIAHKQSGAMTVTVTDSVFDNCGKIDEANGYFAPARFVNNSEIGTVVVNLINNTFKNTIGTNGDILLGDYRAGKESHALTCNIETKVPVMVKASEDVPVSTESKTIEINK